MDSIKGAIEETLSSVQAEDKAYTYLFDRMVIEDGKHISVYLNLLPFRLAYAIQKLVSDAQSETRNSSGASVPR